MTAWLRENGHLVNCKRVRRLPSVTFPGSRLRRPLWRVTRIGNDKQDLLNIIIIEMRSQIFRIWKGQFPFAKGMLADHGNPAPGVAAACADDTVYRCRAASYGSSGVLRRKAQRRD